MTSIRNRTIILIIACLWAWSKAPCLQGQSLARLVDTIQPRMVKIFGAGGAQRLEGHQSGFLISPRGHVLTIWSYVLDSDTVAVVLADGQRFETPLLGADPTSGVAVLQLPDSGTSLDYFDLSANPSPVNVGQRILAFSNLYRVATGNEPVSVQLGHISAIGPLDARRGSVRVPFQDDVLFVDAIVNNPGAPGGAVVNLRGELLGMIGRELRSRQGQTYINHAIPIESIRANVQAIMEGRFVATPPPSEYKPQSPMRLRDLGLVLIPDVLAKTPPFVDAVRTSSQAGKAGIQRDDLIVLLDDTLIPSRAALEAALGLHERTDTIRLSVLRDGRLIEFELQADF